MITHVYLVTSPLNQFYSKWKWKWVGSVGITLVMRSSSQRPSIHKYSSLNCRKTVAGEMARSVRTSSPDVSREQARYKRIMELNSASALESGLLDCEKRVPQVGSAVSYSADRRFRPINQTWPRKLEPLPGRVNGLHQFPSGSPEQVDQDLMLPKLPNSADSNESNFNELGTPDITTDDITTEDLLSHKPEKEPWGISTALVAALSPISLPKSNEGQPGTEESFTLSAIIPSTLAITTPQNDIKKST